MEDFTSVINDRKKMFDILNTLLVENGEDFTSMTHSCFPLLDNHVKPVDGTKAF